MGTLFQPVDPEEGVQQVRRRGVPLRAVVPSMVTLLALCAGLTAIRMALENRFELAVAAIVVAALLDAVDGRIARLLKSTSRFGEQLDSLADFVNFGVAPAMLLYVWRLHDVGSLGWIAALVLAICTGLRLARFNAALDERPRPAWQKGFFEGVPAPAGAMTALLPLALAKVGVPVPEDAAWLVGLYAVVIALLMVSRLPTFSGKSIGADIPRDSVLPVLVAVVLFTALLVSYPYSVIAAGTVLYLAHLPFAWAAWRKRAAVGETAAKATRTGGSGPH